MTRQASGPRWYESRKAFFVTINGVIHNLRSDRATPNRRYAGLALRAPAVKGDATVQEIVEAFLAAKAPEWKPNRLAMHRTALTHFVAVYKNAKCSSLVPGHATAFRQIKPRWGIETFRIFCSALNGCFRWAVEQGLLHENPFKPLRRPKQGTRGDECVITEEQHRLLLATATTRFHDVLEALWRTGQRPGAVLTVEACQAQGDRWVMGEKPGRTLPDRPWPPSVASAGNRTGL